MHILNSGTLRKLPLALSARLVFRAELYPIADDDAELCTPYTKGILNLAQHSTVLSSMPCMYICMNVLNSLRLAGPVGGNRRVRSQCQLPFRGAAHQAYENKIVTHRGQQLRQLGRIL